VPASILLLLACIEMADTDFEDDGPMGDVGDDIDLPDDSSGSEVSALLAPLAANPPMCIANQRQ
jgi:hypothetical protein